MQPDINQALNQARGLAKLKIAQRAQTDLYYLCRYILNYDLMTEATHKELCQYAESVAPRSTRVSEPLRDSASTIVKVSSETPTKKLDQLVVLPSEEPPFSETGLYQPANSDTDTTLDVLAPEGAPTGVGRNDIQDTFDPRKNQLLLLMPRGTFKSSVVTIGLTLQFILQDQDVRVLIDSETFAKAKAFFAEIKGHLEGNEKFRDIFFTLYGVMPDAKKRDNLWSDSQLNIASRKRDRKEPTISCGGVDVTKNGMHYDLIIMDDLHSEQNTANKEQIEKVKTHYKLAYSLLDPGKPLIVIGTRWAYTDVYQYILNEEAQNFNILVRKAYNRDGTLFFPERLTEEFLEKTRHTQGSYIFSCQYMNEPVDDETATFKQSNMIRVPWEMVESMPMNWYLSVDPSYEGPYSDYAALVVCGMNHQKDLYVRHVLRMKMSYSQIIEQIFELYNRYPIKQIVLETVATQKSIQYELVNEQKRRGTWLPITEIRSRTKSKEERIRALAPFYEFGHVFHIRECPQLDELEDELIHFPKGENDDCIDALATILEIAKPSGSRQAGFKKERNSHLYDVLTKPRSPITGV